MHPAQVPHDRAWFKQGEAAWPCRHVRCAGSALCDQPDRPDSSAPHGWRTGNPVRTGSRLRHPRNGLVGVAQGWSRRTSRLIDHSPNHTNLSHRTEPCAMSHLYTATAFLKFFSVCQQGRRALARWWHRAYRPAAIVAAEHTLPNVMFAQDSWIEIRANAAMRSVLVTTPTMRLLSITGTASTSPCAMSGSNAATGVFGAAWGTSRFITFPALF